MVLKDAERCHTVTVTSFGLLLHPWLPNIWRTHPWPAGPCFPSFSYFFSVPYIPYFSQTRKSFSRRREKRKQRENQVSKASASARGKKQNIQLFIQNANPKTKPNGPKFPVSLDSRKWWEVPMELIDSPSNPEPQSPQTQCNQARAVHRGGHPGVIQGAPQAQRWFPAPTLLRCSQDHSVHSVHSFPLLPKPAKLTVFIIS